SAARAKISQRSECKSRNLPRGWFDCAAGRRFVFHRLRSATRLRNCESSWGHAECNRALWPSEFVLVRFILETLKDATLVPAQAVQISQGGPFVFVVKSDNSVELRPVNPGQRQQGDLTVIESGVKRDETVVVTGQLALAPGAKIAPQPYAPQAPAAPDRT